MEMRKKLPGSPLAVAALAAGFLTAAPYPLPPIRPGPMPPMQTAPGKATKNRTEIKRRRKQRRKSK